MINKESNKFKGYISYQWNTS